MVVALWVVQTAVQWLLALLMPQAGGSMDLDLRPFGWITSVQPFGVDLWQESAAQVAVSTVITCMLSSLIAGAFAAYALRRAAGLPVDYGLAARYVRFFPTFFTLQLLVVAMVWLIANTMPFFLFLPAAFGAFVAGFVSLYIVDREMGPIEAVGASARLAYANLGQTLLLLLLSMLVGLATRITFGIAGIWFWPLLAITYASAFRDAAGIHTAGGSLPLNSSTRDGFSVSG